MGNDAYELTIESDSFLYAVHIDVEGFLADDNYFCLMPDNAKAVRLWRTTASGRGLSGYVEALNLIESARIEGESG
jgi:hypothetical protein